jgi:hypothetical protein
MMMNPSFLTQLELDFYWLLTPQAVRADVAVTAVGAFTTFTRQSTLTHLQSPKLT